MHHVEEDDGVEDPQQRALPPRISEMVPRIFGADGLRRLLRLVPRERQLLVSLYGTMCVVSACIQCATQQSFIRALG